MLLSIVDKLNEWVEPFKDFVDRNHGNPIMWFSFILIGIFVFSVVFNILHRNGE